MSISMSAGMSAGTPSSRAWSRDASLEFPPYESMVEDDVHDMVSLRDMRFESSGTCVYVLYGLCYVFSPLYAICITPSHMPHSRYPPYTCPTSSLYPPYTLYAEMQMLLRRTEEAMLPGGLVVSYKVHSRVQ
jgi:hypothetical protein